MPQYYINRLPVDVVRHYIFPHLNYTERNTLNDLTTTQNRIQTKITRDKIAKFEMTLASAILQPRINAVEMLKGEERQDNILNLYKTALPKCLVLCRHNARFREVLVGKLVNYLDPDNSDFSTCSIAFKTEFTAVNCTLLDLINSKYQFSHHLTPIIREDKWSFVDAGQSQIFELWSPYKPLTNKKPTSNKNRARRRYRDQSPYHNDTKFHNWCEARMEKAKTTKN